MCTTKEDVSCTVAFRTKISNIQSTFLSSSHAAVLWHVLLSCPISTTAVSISHCHKQLTCTLQYQKEPTNQNIFPIFLADFESHILDTGRADNMLNKKLHMHADVIFLYFEFIWDGFFSAKKFFNTNTCPTVIIRTASVSNIDHHKTRSLRSSARLRPCASRSRWCVW